jgi:hypothetical protein
MKDKIIHYNRLSEEIQLLASYQMLRQVSHCLSQEQGLYEVRGIMQLLNTKVLVNEKVILDKEEINKVIKQLKA